MTTILSVENTLAWSWGIVINRLVETLPQYEFVRVRRGQFVCPDPRCRTIYHRDVEPDLVRHFDLVLPQNCDSIRMIPTVKGGANIIARVGGFDMADNLDKQRYAQDFARVAAIIATNNQLGAIAGVANGNTVVIPNGVNLERFKPAEKNPNFGRPFTIGFAGNVWGQGAQYKGWQLFVQAGIDLTMDGSKDFAQHYLLHGLNQIAHDQMPEEFYHTIDALILPSKGEGCSNVVSEALACGVPPILTKVGFHGERLEHEKHCLFVSRDVGEIVSAARRLQSDPDLRLRMAGECRAFAEQYHDVRKVAAQYDAVFKSVLAAKEQKGVA